MKTTSLLTLVSISLIASTSVYAADSTVNLPGPFIPAAQTYLLAHGKVATQIGNYTVKIPTTTERCYDNTTPTLITSLTGIEFFGLSQAIGGVINTLALNEATYEIYGQLTAPVNVELQRPNGATVNWEIWCKAEAVA